MKSWAIVTAVLIAFGTAAAAGARPPQALAVVVADLEKLMAPIAAWRERTDDVLRVHAGTTQADAWFLTLRLELKDAVARIAARLDTPELQMLIWPDGAVGQRVRRSAKQPERAAALDVAGADTIVAFMKDRGVWPRRAEGDTYFEVNEAALLAWFGGFVSDQIREFLTMWAEEQAMPAVDDASLMITLDQLERRILMTERFLADFPESPVRDPVGVRHRHYLALYLGGTDNTRAFDYHSGLLQPDLRRMFENYAATHPETVSGRIVAEYLDLLVSSDFRRTPQVTRFLTRVRGDMGDWRFLRY